MVAREWTRAPPPTSSNPTTRSTTSRQQQQQHRLVGCVDDDDDRRKTNRWCPCSSVPQVYMKDGLGGWGCCRRRRRCAVAVAAAVAGFSCTLTRAALYSSPNTTLERTGTLVLSLVSWIDDFSFSPFNREKSIKRGKGKYILRFPNASKPLCFEGGRGGTHHQPCTRSCKAKRRRHCAP